jgi:hypothetical protein
MRLTPRAKLMLLASLFAIPIAASILASRYFRPEPTANYGELLLPPAQIAPHALARADGGRFAFAELNGRWVLVASDSGHCDAACAEKLAAMRQVRLALGRNASRIERVVVVDDAQAPQIPTFAGFEGMVVAAPPPGSALAPGAGNDRAHIYLVDPRGNVMMRWPAKPDMRRMYRDLDRLLKASQIG